MSVSLPRVMVNSPLPPMVRDELDGHVDCIDWIWEPHADDVTVQGIYTYGGRPRVDGRLMDRFPQLRVVSNHGVGVDHIDVAAACARGIHVGYTPGVLDGAVADLAFALILATARRVVEGDLFVRHPATQSFPREAFYGQEVHGACLGVVGLGRIGTQVARRARGFDMTLMYYDPRRNEALERELGARHTTLDGLLSQSDFVVLTVALTDQTRGLIGARELALMKPTATLVNVSRGQVVDTAALTLALKEGRLYAAGLDVTDPEPLPRDHPLLTMPQVVLTPHVGSATIATRRRMAQLSVQNLLAGLRGLPLVAEVKDEG